MNCRVCRDLIKQEIWTAGRDVPPQRGTVCMCSHDIPVSSLRYVVHDRSRDSHIANCHATYCATDISAWDKWYFSFIILKISWIANAGSAVYKINTADPLSLYICYIKDTTTT